MQFYLIAIPKNIPNFSFTFKFLYVKLTTIRESCADVHAMLPFAGISGDKEIIIRKSEMAALIV